MARVRQRRMFHLNDVGEAKPCRAQIRCPFGGEDQHYSTAEHARQGYEHVMAQANLDRLWLITRDRAEKDLVQEFGNEYAQATLRLLDTLRDQYPCKWGRTRAVFLRENTVVKVALNGEGLVASSYELQAYEAGADAFIPMARTELKTQNGVSFAVAERVNVVTGVSYKDLPDWVGYVDCAQVGYTREGKLVAYDL